MAWYGYSSLIFWIVGLSSGMQSHFIPKFTEVLRPNLANLMASQRMPSGVSSSRMKMTGPEFGGAKTGTSSVGGSALSCLNRVTAIWSYPISIRIDTYIGIWHAPEIVMPCSGSVTDILLLIRRLIGRTCRVEVMSLQSSDRQAQSYPGICCLLKSWNYATLVISTGVVQVLFERRAS